MRKVKIGLIAIVIGVTITILVLCGKFMAYNELIPKQIQLEQRIEEHDVKLDDLNNHVAELQQSITVLEEQVKKN